MSTSKIVQGIIGASTAGLVLVHALPNVFPDIILKRYALSEVEVPLHVKNTFEEVAKEMGLKHTENVKLFINNGYGALSVGSTWLPAGAAIGLPRTVLYRNPEELENAGITFKGKRLNWETSIGSKLSDALLFNEQEVKFILAHEVSHLKNLDFTTNCFVPAWWLYFTYRAVPIISRALPPVNPIIKLTVQSCIWIASLLIFLQQNPKLHHNREFVADSAAALLGQGYVQGGISYTLKRMKMNTILRGLNGEGGTRLYSREGNDLKDWSHPDLSARLRKLEEIYAEHYLEDKTTEYKDQDNLLPN